MNFVPESQTPSDESEPINTVCINVLRNCFTKLYNNNERLRTSVHNEPVFNNFLSEWILAHNTLAKLQATKKKLFTCKCDKNDFVIADLHTSSNTPRSVEFYVYAFKEFSHQIWTLLATCLRQCSPNRANKFLIITYWGRNSRARTRATSN